MTKRRANKIHHGSKLPRTSPSNDRLTVRQLAERWDRHENTIRFWVHSPKYRLPAIFLGGRLMFDDVACDRWLAARRLNPEAAGAEAA